MHVQVGQAWPLIGRIHVRFLILFTIISTVTIQQAP
jgi:hypothetical protein